MEINWFTFGAQVVNFLILVWLLKRFLYRPVIDAMDEREKTIAARLDDAERARVEAEHVADRYRQKTVELEHAKDELLAQAGRAVEDWKRQHLEKARDEVDSARKKWYRGIQRERNAFLREMRLRAGEQVYETARNVILKLSDESLERRIVETFLSRLNTLDKQQRSAITTAIRNSRHHVTVKSGFPVSEELRQRILHESRNSLGHDVDIDFHVSPDVICGLELQAAGYKVAWSAGEALDALEEEFARTLDEVAVES